MVEILKQAHVFDSMGALNGTFDTFSANNRKRFASKRESMNFPVRKIL